MSQSQGLDQAIYLIAKELVAYAKQRGGQLKPGGGLKLSIAYTLLKWIEEMYRVDGLSDIIANGLVLSHAEISTGETVLMKHLEKITVGLMQKFEVTNQALRGVPVIPAPDLGTSSGGKKDNIIRRGLKKLGL